MVKSPPEEFEERIQLRLERLNSHPNRKVRDEARRWLRERGLDHLIPDVKFPREQPVEVVAGISD